MRNQNGERRGESGRRALTGTCVCVSGIGLVTCTEPSPVDDLRDAAAAFAIQCLSPCSNPQRRQRQRLGVNACWHPGAQCCNAVVKCGSAQIDIVLELLCRPLQPRSRSRLRLRRRRLPPGHNPFAITGAIHHCDCRGCMRRSAPCRAACKTFSAPA
jgi:hypothetical protein